MVHEPTEQIAGHTFTLSRDAVCTRLKSNGEEMCGKSWGFVRTATEADIGKPDIPHAPNLTGHELAEIKARVERERLQDAAIWAAVVGVSA